MLSNVILNEEDTSDQDVRSTGVSPTASAEILESSVLAQNGLSVERNDEDGTLRVVVTEENATMTLGFPAQPQSDTFVEIQGLAFSSYLADDGDSDGILGYLKEQLRRWRYDQGTDYIVTFTTPDGFADWIYGYTPNSHLYGGKNNWLVNLGYSAEGKGEVTITFPYLGIYTMDSMDIVAEPVDALTTLVDERREPALRTTATTNAYRIEGTVDEAGYVLATIPWSTGWTATLDGEKVEPLRADVAFMAVQVDEGDHVIELSYETPFLAPRRHHLATGSCRPHRHLHREP